jgi:hypothetical protein
MYSTPLTPGNLTETLPIKFIYIPFCRALKIASIYTISFHNRSERGKTMGTIVIIWSTQKWYISRTIQAREIFFLCSAKIRINGEKCAEFHALSF